MGHVVPGQFVVSGIFEVSVSFADSIFIQEVRGIPVDGLKEFLIVMEGGGVGLAVGGDVHHL